MNKILATLVSWTAGLSAFAQLGTVNLNNDFTPPGGTTKAFISRADGPLLAEHGSVEILDFNGNVIRSGGLAADGLFFFGITEIPGTNPGGSGWIIIRAWDSTTGSGFSSAAIGGQSIIHLIGLGGGDIPSPSLATVGDFTGVLLTRHLDTPEPSMVALAAIGLFGLFMVGRRR